MAPRAFSEQIYIKQEKILQDSGPMSSGDIEDAADLNETITTEDGSFQSFHEDEISDLSTSKYQEYDLRVDPLQDDRAIEIKLCPCSAKRPHMRAFHFAWWSYHVAFLMWFSITPLQKEIQKTLNLTKQQLWTSSIAGVSSTIVMRFILGPFCDKYGPRILMGIILLSSAVPTALTGLVNSASGLTILRFFIGVGGSTFVMCQYWTTRMFSRERAGTANAIVGGWGNLGGGVTQLLVGSFLFPLLKNAFDGDAEKAWRTACVVPATLGLITAFCVVKFSDDCPKGNYSKMKKRDEMVNVSASVSMKSGLSNSNTWLIFVQYACCFGVEMTMNNAAALYFAEEFHLSTPKAAATASIFGWMNLFARGVGGFVSDKLNDKGYGLRGRLYWQSFVLLFEGIMVICFAFCTSLTQAIIILVFFSIFVQAAEGSTYGIVPHINPAFTGSISGIIGSGGNVGAVVFGIFFREMSFKKAFTAMGIIIVLSSLLSVFVNIEGHNNMIKREDEPTKSNKTSETTDEEISSEIDSDESH